MQEEEPHEIAPAFEHGYNQRGKIVLTIENFPEFSELADNNVRTSDPISVCGFLWRIRARIVQQFNAMDNHVNWLALFLECTHENVMLMDWARSVTFNFKVHSQFGEDVGPTRSLHSVFTPRRNALGITGFIECKELLNENYGFISNGTVQIEASIITNMPIGFKFGTESSSTVFKWPIFDFNTVATREDSQNRLESDDFLIGDCNKRFSLRFDPTNFYDDESKDYSSIWMCAKGLEEDESVVVRYNLWIENKVGEKIFDTLFATQTCEFDSSGSSYGNSKFVRSYNLYLPGSDFAKDDFIFICCEARVLPSPDFECALSETEMKLLTLRNQGFAGFCTIKVEEQAFEVDKCLLMSQSPAFESMFSTDTIESRTSAVNIKGVAPSTIQAFIEYMTNGTVGNFEGIIRPLFLFADRYCIEHLKIKCAEFFLRRINKGNSLKMLIFSFICGDYEFKQCVKGHFICYYLNSDFKEVFQSTEWQQLMEQDEELANEIMDACKKD